MPESSSSSIARWGQATSASPRRFIGYCLARLSSGCHTYTSARRGRLGATTPHCNNARWGRLWSRWLWISWACFLSTAREIATSSCLWTISQSGQRCKLSRTKVLPPLLNAWSAKCPAIAGLDYYYVLREWLREMHLQRLGLGYDTRCLGEDLAHGNGRYGSIVSPKSTSQWVQAVPCGV